MTRPTVRDIPGMAELLRNGLEDSPATVKAIGDYIGDLWHAKPGEAVTSPYIIPLQLANEICSLVLAFRDQQQRLGGKVEIKKVAETRGSRFNSGKARFDLLDWEAMAGLAGVLEFGATKYAPYNWKKGLPYMEIIASTLRHIAAITRGEDIDSETGKPHADHIQCNGMFLSWMMKNRPDMDDRHKG
jgi:dATP/dGTP diphosphohydrolase, N-terminal